MRARVTWVAAGVLVATAAFGLIGPHAGLHRRWLLPGYWYLAATGRWCYDRDLAILRHGDPHRAQVALTFDDGPDPVLEPQILAILDGEHVRATFFLIGKHVRQHPALARALNQHGQEIGSHTYDHLRLPGLTVTEVAKEVHFTEQAMALADPRIHLSLLRPPGGDFTPSVARQLKALGYTTVLWSDAPGDYDPMPAAEVERRTLDEAENGAIIELHESYPSTVQALPAIIGALRAQGYQFVTVGEMLKGVK